MCWQSGLARLRSVQAREQGPGRAPCRDQPGTAPSTTGPADAKAATATGAATKRCRRIGCSSPTGTPLRVTTKDSPRSSSRRISPLSFRSSRWVICRAIPLSLAPVRHAPNPGLRARPRRWQLSATKAASSSPPRWDTPRILATGLSDPSSRLRSQPRTTRFTDGVADFFTWDGSECCPAGPLFWASCDDLTREDDLRPVRSTVICFAPRSLGCDPRPAVSRRRTRTSLN